MNPLRVLIAGLCVTASIGAGGSAAETAARPAFNVPQRPDGPFQLLDGDRVVFVGDTLIERAQAADYLETFLTVRYPDRNVVFRNLGWSGDTVYGDARAGFGTAADGFEQLKQQIDTIQPTVIFVAYGGNSSFDGVEGIERFAQGYRALLEMLRVTRAELVLLSPIRHEDLGPPLPDPTDHNRALVAYTVEISRIAERRRHLFLDLFHEVMPLADRSKRRFTDNGIHLSDYGYWRLARCVESELGFDDVSNWRLTLDARTGRVVSALGGAGESRIEDVVPETNRLRFTLVDTRLPQPVAPQYDEGGRSLAIESLPPGHYTLSIDGQAVQTASAEDWARGLTLRTGPEFEQVERLRKTIVSKNRLYFHRWRPQNETYLFGFRKYEQGQNAREIPMFDPLVSAKEAEITQLRRPQPRRYELVPKER